MIRGTTLFATALCVAAFVGDAPAQEASGADDPIFQAMDAELQRARGLRMKDLDNPYFLSAYVSQDESFSVSASFGALQSRGGGKSASISTNVRVGTMELDNTNFSSFSFGGWGGGQAVPTDPDVDALRQALWLDFDSSYKSAAQAIAKKRAYLASNTVKELLPDNQAVETTDVVLPLMELTLDRERWTAIVKRVSAVFREYDFVHGCTVSLQAVAAHQYYLSTDPARHRFPFPYCTFSIDSSTQCDDGMVVSSDWNRMTRTADDLPSEEDLVAVAHEVAKRLGELKDAPTAEDYWGPVLFTGDAAADFFLNTIATPDRKSVV